MELDDRLQYIVERFGLQQRIDCNNSTGIEVEFRHKGHYADKLLEFAKKRDIPIVEKKSGSARDSYIIHDRNGTSARFRRIILNEKHYYQFDIKIRVLSRENYFAELSTNLTEREYDRFLKMFKPVLDYEGQRSIFRFSEETPEFGRITFCDDRIDRLNKKKKVAYMEIEKIVEDETQIEEAERLIKSIALELGMTESGLTTVTYPQMILDQINGFTEPELFPEIIEAAA